MANRCRLWTVRNRPTATPGGKCRALDTEPDGLPGSSSKFADLAESADPSSSGEFARKSAEGLHQPRLQRIVTVAKSAVRTLPRPRVSGVPAPRVRTMEGTEFNGS